MRRRIYTAKKIRKLFKFFNIRNDKFSNLHNIDSYEDVFLSNLIISKCLIFSKEIQLENFQFSENQLRLLIPFAFTKKNNLRIIDFGGSAGTHFFIINTLIGKNRNLDWRIVENSQLVNLSSKISHKGLSFFDSISKARLNFSKPDIGIASSVFEYVPEPMVSLSEFLSVGCDIIYLTRTCLNVEHEVFCGVQTSNLKNNGPGGLPEGIRDQSVSYPIKISPLSDFIREIEKNYEIIFTVIEKSAVHKIGKKIFDQYGILARRKVT